MPRQWSATKGSTGIKEALMAGQKQDTNRASHGMSIKTIMGSAESLCILEID
jgi:hypothetical protein